MAVEAASSTLSTANHTLRVALVGAPNSGKSSLFNAITGGAEKVANYPGVTVEKVTGVWKGAPGHHVTDLPGLYSLRALSEDEHVALQALKGPDRPEAIIFVADAVSLERGLFLYSQVAELGIPLVVALTMTDVAEKEGRPLDLGALEGALGAPVIATQAHKSQQSQRQESLKDLASALDRAVAPNLSLGWSPAVEEAVTLAMESSLAPQLTRDQVRRALLDEDSEAVSPWGREVESIRQRVFSGALQPKVTDAQTRYSWAGSVLRKARKGASLPNPFTQKVDAFLTHRVFGLGFFAFVMYGLFMSIYTLAKPLMDLIDGGFGWLGDQAGSALAFNETLQSLVVEGIIGGVGSAVIFLPQILILFALIAALEGTGYLARASFLMDRLFGWCGLSGRAFIPLLSSFACAIPGMMAARVMPDTKSRLMTILVAPLMSCSARLPVYLLVIGVVIEPKFGPWAAGLALFLMHFVGLAVAVPLVIILNRGVIKAKRLPFVMDMPRYQWPKLRDIWTTVRLRGVLFLKTAGTVIVVMSLVIWAALHFPRSEAQMNGYRTAYASQSESFKTRVSEDLYLTQQQRRDSILGRVGRFVEPVFIPAGFDWRLTTAILAAFPAREVVVSAMSVLFAVEDGEDSKPLMKALAEASWPDGTPLITIWSATAFMVFFALCAQCMSTLAVMRRETGSWKWPLASFAAMTAMAYLAAVAINQLGRLVGG
jgi:ferrous iron transport protein B